MAVKDDRGTHIGATFDVYRRFVSYHSPVFARQFVNGRRTLDLGNEIDPEAFEIFVGWLYTQNLSSGRASLPSSEQLIELWLIADYAQIPKLQNEVVRVLESYRTPSYCPELPANKFARVYRRTREGCPLRCYIADVLVAENRVISEDYPRALLFDIIKAFADCVDSYGATISALTRLRPAPKIFSIDKYYVEEINRESPHSGAEEQPISHKRSQTCQTWSNNQKRRRTELNLDDPEQEMRWERARDQESHGGDSPMVIID